MSRRAGAPYEDHIDETGKTLIYEGHDCSKTHTCPDPKRIDQPEFFPSGVLTQNGLFAASAKRYKQGNTPPELVRVFEKIKDGIWVYNGIFELIDYTIEQSKERLVFKFKLRLVHSDDDLIRTTRGLEQDDDRIIPSWVKLEVWKRDKGTCQIPGCGATTGLHFDHIIPYSRGGSSKEPANIQILCGRHNLAKRDRIE